MDAWVKKSALSGRINIPPSKSQTLRSILFASLATGQSTIFNFLNSPDTHAMIRACQELGARITFQDDTLSIIGVGGQPSIPENIIDAGNSGQVLRFVGALAGLLDGYTVITGDYSIRYNRPAQPLLSGLEQLGCLAVATKRDGRAPIIIQGPMRGGKIIIDGQDSQPVSGLIIASAFAKEPVTIEVLNSGEHEWIEVTLSWLDRLGISYIAKEFNFYQLFGQSRYPGFVYSVPADFSSVAFPIVAACITHSSLETSPLNFDDSQGDKKLIKQFISYGLNVDIHEQGLRVNASDFLIPGMNLDVQPFIDALPILTVLACYANSESLFYGAQIARLKESDRLATITQELRKMGASIEEYPDALKITPRPLSGAKVLSHDDHRIAMALAVAGLGASGETMIQDIDCIAKSFPGFMECFQDLGANIVTQ